MSTIPPNLSDAKDTAKITTRSTSSASATGSAAPPLSADEFRRTIAGITKTQNLTLSQCKNLSISLDSKFNELKTIVDLLTSQMGELRSENASLRADLASLEMRVATLESSATNFSPRDNNVNHVPNLLQELSEREKSMFNVVVHGLPESTQLLPAARISDDIKCINEAIQPFSMSLPPNPKLFRLGRVNALSEKPRPLKVVFPSKELAFQFVSDYNTSKRSADSGSHRCKTIHISRDRTFLERQEIRGVYAELDNRKKQGELNISIRYKNGIPRIVQNSQGSGVAGNPNHRPSSSHSKN